MASSCACRMPTDQLNATRNSSALVAGSCWPSALLQMLLDKGADVNAKGLLGGSESGLEHGTALEAAEDPEVKEILKKAMNKKQ